MRSVPGAVATRVVALANSTVLSIETRSLPLPVLTASWERFLQRFVRR